MITLEQVEQLRAKVNVSYDEAKEALEASNGDLLDAVIYLEKNGKVTPPTSGGYYSSFHHDGESSDRGNGQSSPLNEKKTCTKNNGESFHDFMRRVWQFCCMVINKGNTNSFDIYRGGEYKTGLPITILVVLIVFAFWITVPLIIVGLFFGFRYQFNGPDFKKNTVNHVMDTAAKAAEDIKQSFTKPDSKSQNP